jgi:hypothetical protein
VNFLALPSARRQRIRRRHQKRRHPIDKF